MNLSTTLCVILLSSSLLFQLQFLEALEFPGAKDEVTSLPGLTVPLAFPHYSGYLESENGTFLHYWFVESASGHPEKDPVILWLNGGPGCSSMLGAFTELGPLNLDKNSGKLEKNPYAWNTNASIIFLETPAGVGFSYRLNVTGENYTTRVYKSSDHETAILNLGALKSFYQKFPQFLSNPFYIAGESYAGIYIPTLAQLLVAQKFPENFLGVAIGNGLLDEQLLGSSLIHFGYYHGLIDSQIYQNVLKKCCSAHLPANSLDFSQCAIYSKEQDLDCSLARAAASDKLRFFSPVNPYNIYGKCIKDEKMSPFYEMVSEEENRIHPDLVSQKLMDRMLAYTGDEVEQENDKVTSLGAGGGAGFRNTPQCVNFDHLEVWLNSPEVKAALNIHVNLSRAWVPCSFDVSLLYERQYQTVAAEIKNLVDSGKKVLIYNGDVDSVCNFIGDQWFVDSLGYKTLTSHAPWSVDGQIAGFTTIYEHNLTFTTIRGAGHTVPEDKPAEALKMVYDFLFGIKN